MGHRCAVRFQDSLHDTARDCLHNNSHQETLRSRGTQQVCVVTDEDSEPEAVPHKVQKARIREQRQAAQRKRKIGNDGDLVSGVRMPQDLS